MARLLDAMRQAGSEVHLLDTAELTQPAPRLAPETAAVADDNLEDVNMPFIEVGPSRSMDGSADVLAMPGRLERKATPLAPVKKPAFQPLAKAGHTLSRVSKHVEVYHVPTGATARHYQELLCEVRAAGTANASAHYFVTEAGNGSATPVVLNLAITAARRGLRTVVVDADETSGSVARSLGICDRPGVAEVLAGRATLVEALQETPEPELLALTPGRPTPTPTTPEAYRWLYRQLRERYDWIVVTGAAWNGRATALTAGLATEVAFLIRPLGQEEPESTAKLTAQLTELGLPLVGTILAC